MKKTVLFAMLSCMGIYAADQSFDYFLVKSGGSIDIKMPRGDGWTVGSGRSAHGFPGKVTELGDNADGTASGDGYEGWTIHIANITKSALLTFCNNAHACHIVQVNVK